MENNLLVITLTISLFLDFLFLGLVLILWFIRCRQCSKDKERRQSSQVRRVFKPTCEKCEKGVSLPKGNGKAEKLPKNDQKNIPNYKYEKNANTTTPIAKKKHQQNCQRIEELEAKNGAEQRQINELKEEIKKVKFNYE